jgi:DNA-directed RNA polymerase subunit L
MKLNIKTKEPHYVEIEITGVDRAFPEALRELVLEDDDVEFASYTIDHPQVGIPLLIVRTKKKSPIFVINHALKTLRKQAAALKAEVKEMKKGK